MTTGERIKLRRKSLSLSAETLALKINVSPATIYRYEKGDIEKVPITILEPLAEALQTTPEYLMGWNDKPDMTNHDDPHFTVKQEDEIIPQTEEARILCPGIDSMPPEERKRALEMMKLMFDKYF